MVAETRGPMAVVVLGGLTLSTALSLLVVPAFYLVTDRLKARIMPGSVDRHPPTPAAPGAPPVTPPAAPAPPLPPHPTPATTSRIA